MALKTPQKTSYKTSLGVFTEKDAQGVFFSSEKDSPGVFISIKRRPRSLKVEDKKKDAFLKTFIFFSVVYIREVQLAA